MFDENVKLNPVQNRLCMAFFVSGDIYPSYIPFLLYSLFKAYPEYFIIISVKGTLSDKIKVKIKDLGHRSNFIIKENFGDEFAEDPNIWKTLRWVHIHPEYYNFEYVYIGDIDYIFTREDIPLLERKIKICEMENLPYANTTKADNPETRGLRMTGIHFYKVSEYLPEMIEVMEKYKEQLKKGMPKIFYNNKLKRYDNQMALRIMIEEAELGMPEFNTFEYNGLHIGHSRCKGRWEQFLKEDGLHRGYMKYFLENLDTPEFRKLYESTSKQVWMEINRMVNAGYEYFGGVLDE